MARLPLTPARWPDSEWGFHGQGLGQGHVQSGVSGAAALRPWRGRRRGAQHGPARRNLDDFRALVQGLTRKGVRAEFVKELLVFTGEDSPIANLMLSVTGAFAEFERSLIGGRQREGITLAQQRGAHKGGKDPHAGTGLRTGAVQRRSEIRPRQRLRHQPGNGLPVPPPGQTFLKSSPDDRVGRPYLKQAQVDGITVIGVRRALEQRKNRARLLDLFGRIRAARAQPARSPVHLETDLTGRSFVRFRRHFDMEGHGFLFPRARKEGPAETVACTQ